MSLFLFQLCFTASIEYFFNIICKIITKASFLTYTYSVGVEVGRKDFQIHCRSIGEIEFYFEKINIPFVIAMILSTKAQKKRFQKEFDRFCHDLSRARNVFFLPPQVLTLR